MPNATATPSSRATRPRIVHAPPSDTVRPDRGRTDDTGA